MHHNVTSFNSIPWTASLAVSLTLSFLIATTAEAAIQRPLDELKVIEVPISKQDLTRITVKEDRILNVFGVTGEYVLEADEDQGQVFIRPAGLNSNKPIHLTLTTEGGHTQDLRLIPQDKKPEALILKAEDNSKKELPWAHGSQVSHSPLMKDSITGNDITHDDITREGVEDLIDACREGRIPLGYKITPIPLERKNRQESLPPGVKPLTEPHSLVRELRGEKLRCLTYEVRNDTKTSLKFSEEEFAKSLSSKIPNIIAILMPTKTLNSGERTHVHVVASSPY
ncbi:MAG: type-F conjugative transfer system secretin TraK [Proteobacteria bacterium]|nr:type-F conjugative transfer system secretin TraK [Pseudomonadota bacterium]